MTPTSGSGASQTFALESSDTAGAGNVQQVWVATNQINLLNDIATAWLSATLGSAATLQNSQCSLNVGASSVTSSGKTLTLNLAMTFEPAYAGAKNIYLYAGDIVGRTVPERPQSSPMLSYTVLAREPLLKCVPHVA